MRVQCLDQAESSILTWQMFLSGQLLHLPACPLPAPVCLSSPAPPAPLAALGAVCLLREGQAICTSSAACAEELSPYNGALIFQRLWHLFSHLTAAYQHFHKCLAMSSSC